MNTPDVDAGAPPFAGLKVIDCASYIAAPAAAMLLGDFGADVIKIEPPDGDPHRDLYQRVGAQDIGRNFVWDLNSRNKRSLALDLKQPAGQAVLHRLVAQADVFITNLPLPVRDRLGISAAHLRPLNPRLVYASMTGYGETGPEAAKTAFDVTAYWARSGLMDLVRADHSAPPTRPVAGMGDHPSAATLFAGITMALYRRERSGQGGEVRSSLMANGLWSNAIQVQAQLSGARFPPRQGRHLAPNPLSNIYRCADGRWLSLVILNEARQWPALLGVLGLPGLATDPRFAIAAARASHSAELIHAFDQAFSQQDLATWKAALNAAGITFGVVATLADLADDEQMQATGALLPCPHHGGLTLASPLTLDGSPQRPPGPAPTLGQHSAELLREAGWAEAEIARLIKDAVVFGPAQVPDIARPSPSEGDTA